MEEQQFWAKTFFLTLHTLNPANPAKPARISQQPQLRSGDLSVTGSFLLTEPLGLKEQQRPLAPAAAGGADVLHRSQINVTDVSQQLAKI